MDSSSSSTNSKKKVPDDIIQLLDVAVYSYGCQSGLRAHHKIRGGPVLEGVIAFFGRLVNLSKPETKETFVEVSKDRFGSWEVGSPPTRELLNFVCSRTKTLKSKGKIRDVGRPEVPERLFCKQHRYEEETDRLHTSTYPICWRCGERCDFCRSKKKMFPHYLNNFRAE